jgi:hypothetical protein
MWEYIAASPSLVIFKPSDLSARYGITADAVKTVVLAALTAGLLRPVYRIANASVLDRQARAWTPELVTLRRKWETTDGDEVDGADPKEIAIAFERTQVDRDVTKELEASRNLEPDCPYGAVGAGRYMRDGKRLPPQK